MKEQSKMNFKKTLSLALVLAMLVCALASCNLDDILSSLTGSTTANSTASTTPTTTKPQEDTTSSTTNNSGSADPSPDNWEDLYNIITIAEALEIANQTGDTTPTERYYIKGTIVNVSNPTYGEMTVSDGANEIFVYGTYSADGAIRYDAFEEKPVKGDEVLLHCQLNTHNGSAQVKNARLIDFKPADKSDIDASAYTVMTIDEARDSVIGTLVNVTGVVARITYANGMKPSGVYLVDGTNSIYIYDADIAGQVSIGNKITVLAEKDMWILDSESNNAQTFGYKGCCQLFNAVLYDNDKGTNEIDFTWCEERSVKDILETPVTENVTTTVYKTTALVKKVEGTGFTNYYFFDLDGATGAYTYTQCSGADFAWLDEFDGKLCTVYLSPMNAKSTASDCYFRFLPVAVFDEGFEFDVANAPKHVVEYYGVGQFLSEYTGNPLTVLSTSVSSELLGFDNVVLSYESDNESVVYFTTETPGTVVLNCKGSGTANVTITATHNGNSYSETVTITVSASESVEANKVINAINAENDTEVTIEGIVGPSLVNQTGFYLIDETGTIAVRVNADAFEGLAIGQRIVVKGTRTITKEGGGQICIDSAEVVANYYGKVDYSTDSFVTDKSFEEIIAIADSPEATTQVYVVTASVKLVESQYYANIYLTNGTTDFILYCSNASQYGFLKAFAGQEVTVELTLCDWNARGLKGCVLSVITEDGKIYNELNFTSNN